MEKYYILLLMSNKIYFSGLINSPVDTVDYSSAAVAAAGCKSVLWMLGFDCSSGCILDTDCSFRSYTLGYNCPGYSLGCSLGCKTEATKNMNKHETDNKELLFIIQGKRQLVQFIAVTHLKERFTSPYL